MGSTKDVADRVFDRLTVARVAVSAPGTSTCGHGEQVVRVSRVWRLCSVHPEVGAMCDECMNRHLVEHAAECDACGLPGAKPLNPITLDAKVLYPLPGGDVVVDLALHATMNACANGPCGEFMRQVAESLAVRVRELLALETLYAMSGDAPSVN